MANCPSAFMRASTTPQMTFAISPTTARTCVFRPEKRCREYCGNRRGNGHAQRTMAGPCKPDGCAKALSCGRNLGFSRYAGEKHMFENFLGHLAEHHIQIGAVAIGAVEI